MKKILLKTDIKNRIINYVIVYDNNNISSNDYDFMLDYKEDIKDIILGETCYNDGKFYTTKEILKIDEDPQVKLQIEKDNIMQWLNDNDYKVNKFILGEYTLNDEKWLKYVKERKEKLSRFNQIDEILKN